LRPLNRHGTAGYDLQRQFQARDGALDVLRLVAANAVRACYALLTS
jgi:hypothetical protein